METMNHSNAAAAVEVTPRKAAHTGAQHLNVTPAPTASLFWPCVQRTSIAGRRARPADH